MLQVFTQTWTEASAADRSGLRMSVRPLDRTVRSAASRQNGSRRRRSAAAEKEVTMNESSPASDSGRTNRLGTRRALLGFGRQKRFHEGIVERVDIGEVLASIIISLAEDVVFNEVKY